MATVTGITAAKAAAIEDASVVTAAIVSGNLILTKGDGGTVNVGAVVGATGAAGARWYSGTGAPSNSSYSIGDWYLDDANGNVYEKTAALVWTVRDNLTGPSGAAGSKWYSGTGAPPNGSYNIGDWYINDANGDSYEKTASSVWTLRDNLTGPTGAAGADATDGLLSNNFPVSACVSMSDATSAITTGVKDKVRFPFAFTITDIRIAVGTADTAAIMTVDILNGAGTSIFTTKPTINVNQKTSVTATTAMSLAITSIAEDEELTCSVTVTGTVARNLKLWIIGTRVVASPITVPAQVGTVTAIPGNTQVGLSWGAPSNGGSAITDYIVQYKLNSSGTWLTFSDGVATGTTATVTGITNGSLYDFRVAAANTIGTGAASASISSTPLTTPGQPTALSGTPASTSNVLTWTAPASNGGSAITDYLVEYKAAASGTWLTFTDGTSSSTGATVTGLTSATSYNFRVSAINAAGTGTASTTYTASTTSGGTTRTVNGNNSNKGMVVSSGATYSTVRTTGVALGAVTAYMQVGQIVDGGTYDCDEAFIEFNTNLGGTVSSITSLKIDVTDTSEYDSDTFNIYAKDFGAGVTTADWVNGSSPGTLLATFTGAGGAGLKTCTIVNSGALISAINTAGTTRFVVMGASQAGNVAPVVYDRVSLFATNCELVYVTV